MYACFNGATAMPYSLEQDIEAAARAGFRAIELWGAKLGPFVQAHGIAGLREMLQAHALEPAAIDFIAIDLASSEPLGSALHDLPRYGEIALGIGCDTLLTVVMGDRPELTQPEALNFLAKLMLPLCTAAGRYGLRLALEPLGGHRLVAGPRQALEIVQISRQNNLGISWDWFHFFKSGALLDDIRAVPVDRLYIVHADDAPPGDPAALQDADRVWPGEGVLPLDAYWAVLREMHYAGPVSVEVPNPTYARLGPEALARTAFASLARYLPVPAS